MIKYGEVNKNTHADDDPSKKASHAEKHGFRILSKEAAEKETEVELEQIKNEH